MRARANSKYYLEVIPVILNEKNHVCLPGQAFDTRKCRVHIYSALSCDHKAWYSDVQDDDPISEYDMCNNNLEDSIVGYNQGLHIINLKTGKITFKPITVSEFIKVRNKTKPVQFGDHFLSLFDKVNKDKTDVYTTDKLKENDLGIVYDMNSIKKWYSNFPVGSYLKALKNSLIGIPANKVSTTTIHINDFWDNDTAYLPIKYVEWNYKDPWNAFNSKIRKWCYIGH